MASEGREELVDRLRGLAREIRQDVVRMIYSAGSGNPGGSLSVVDLVTALVFQELRLDPQRPDSPERDRLVPSKGHAAPALDSALARRGFFPVEELATYRKTGARLQGHVDRLRTPGVDVS